MNTTNFQKGDKVKFEMRGGATSYGIFSHITKTGVAYIKELGTSKGYERKPENVTLVERGGLETILFPDSQTEGGSPIEFDIPKTNKEIINEMFDVNRRMEIYAGLVRKVIRRKRLSLVVVGSGGLGKTKTVKRQLERANLSACQVIGGEDAEDDGACVVGDYVWVNGYTSAKGLYNTLYHFNDKIIIFNDCDEALTNPVAKNILKAALEDDGDERLVCWNTQALDQSVPDRFVFTGVIIFISNLKKARFDQAILTRCSKFDITMNKEEKLQRLQWIIDTPEEYFRMKVSMEDKQKAMDFIKLHSDKMDNDVLSVRTLNEVVDYVIDEENDSWEDEALYSMLF